MSIEIVTITLPMPMNIALVNCYLLKTDNGFFLIDTGFTNTRNRLETELRLQGCEKGNFNLIILTHGDFDHTGNAVYLRNRFGARIAMHSGDAGMLENGDMFWNRKFENRILMKLMKMLIPFKVENQGKPDLLLEDEASLSNFGLPATVYNTPGHSTGSICILDADGNLFCGDLFTNSTGKARLNSMLYDHEAGQASYERLKQRHINRVYAGHGAPFAWEALQRDSSAGG